MSLMTFYFINHVVVVVVMVVCYQCLSPLICEFEPGSGEVYSIQLYVIKFVSDLQQVDGFFRLLRFPPHCPPRYRADFFLKWRKSQ